MVGADRVASNFWGVRSAFSSFASRMSAMQWSPRSRSAEIRPLGCPFRGSRGFVERWYAGRAGARGRLDGGGFRLHCRQAVGQGLRVHHAVRREVRDQLGELVRHLALHAVGHAVEDVQ